MVNVPDGTIWPRIRRAGLVLALLCALPSVPCDGHWLLFRVALSGWDSTGHVLVCRNSEGREGLTHSIVNIICGIQRVRDRPPSCFGNSFRLLGYQSGHL